MTYVHVQLPDGTYGQRGSRKRDYKYAIVREGFTVEEAIDRFTYEIHEMDRLWKAHNFWLGRRDLIEKYRMQLDDALHKRTATLTDPAWEVFVDEPRGAFYLTPVRPEVLGWSQTYRNAWRRQATEANRQRDRVLVLDAIPGKAPKAT